MSKKLPVSLRISTLMSKRSENNLIRFPMRARNYLSLTSNRLLLGKGGFQIEVGVKRAFREDVQRLLALRKKKNIDEETLLTTGFVTRSTYQTIAGREQESSPWISTSCSSITIGCDPEFGLISEDGRLHRGDHVLPGTKKLAFGADGPGVEVRPDPSSNHIEVVNSIDKILRDPPHAAKDFKWIGGATYQDINRVYWFGGHIHIGRPVGLQKNQALPAFSTIANLLDHCLSLPLLTFDKPNPHLRRNGCQYNYGKAGDIRYKDNQSRFEYRVPSGLWVTHPSLAKVVMGVAKAVAEDFYTNAEAKDYTSVSRPHLPLQHRRAVVLAINSAKLEVPENLLHYWEGLIDSLGNKDEYAEEIEALKTLVRYAAEKVHSGLKLDIKENWGEQRPLLSRPPKDLKQVLNTLENKK